MIIVSKRLVIQPVEEDGDVEMVVHWLNSSKLMKHSEQRHKEHTYESQREYIDSRDWPEYGGIYVGGNIIGTVGAELDWDNGVANVGIMIGSESHNGKGFGTEAWGAYCRFLLSQVGLRKIEAGLMASNLAMASLCLRSGMKEEGIRRGHFKVKHDEGYRYIDMLQFGMFE